MERKSAYRARIQRSRFWGLFEDADALLALHRLACAALARVWLRRGGTEFSSALAEVESAVRGWLETAPPGVPFLQLAAEQQSQVQDPGRAH